MAALGPRSRILFVAENFHQGWGGSPESIRLMARRLALLGVSSDVVDRGRLHRAVGTLTALPEDEAGGESFDLEMVQGYDALLQVGPWQNPLRVREIIRRRSPGRPYYYLPRGGLARTEFKGRRGIKKFPYFLAVEARFVQAVDAIVFSSNAERRAITPLYRGAASEEIVPDYFDRQPVQVPGSKPAKELRLGFLAEIGPGKGLLPLMRALALWVPRRPDGRQVRLTVGGGVRAGADRYFAHIREISSGIAGLEVDYRGRVSHGDRPSFYAGIDLFVVPSRCESFGLTVLESTSAGCALLCSSRVGALEHLPPSPRIIVCDDVTPSSFESGLDRAASAVEQAGDRQLSMDVAAAAVAQINAEADRQWRRLLRLEGDRTESI